jgi:hypothetical protein
MDAAPHRTERTASSYSVLKKRDALFRVMRERSDEAIHRAALRKMGWLSLRSQ